MSAVPLPTRNYPQGHTESRMETIGNITKNPDWMRIGVGATLLTGSLLLLTGKRKAGLLVTAAGTALALVEHREVVSEWWEALPQHLQKAQTMLEQAQNTIDDLTQKRDQVMSLFNR